MTTSMTQRNFNPHTFLTTIGSGRRLLSFQKSHLIFAQGEASDGLFFIQAGKVQLSVVSEGGKEATLGILGEDDFFGEGGLAGQLVRMSSATAMTDCVLLHIKKKAMMLAMSREPKLSATFVKYLLKRNIRYQDDLVDQLFNSSEKRLARILLLMAHFGKEGSGDRNRGPQVEPGNACRDGGNDPFAGQLLHEQIQKAWLRQLRQWTSLTCPQLTAERRVER